MAHLRAKTQKDAAAAGAGLMADQARGLDPEMRLTVLILSALQWWTAEGQEEHLKTMT